MNRAVRARLSDRLAARARICILNWSLALLAPPQRPLDSTGDWRMIGPLGWELRMNRRPNHALLRRRNALMKVLAPSTSLPAEPVSVLAPGFFLVAFTRPKWSQITAGCGRRLLFRHFELLKDSVSGASAMLSATTTVNGPTPPCIASALFY